MSQKTEKAVNNYKNGYTCAQAVACAFCEEAGIDEKTMFRLTVFCMPGASACRPEHLGSLIAKRRKMEVAASSFPAVVLLNS